MKKFTILFSFAGIFAFFSLASCSKSGGTPYDDANGTGGGGGHVYTASDTTAPQITIYTPVADQVFSSGTAINITGKITDDYGLYRGTIKVINNSNGLVQMNQPYEIHGLLSYNFNINHTVNVIAPADFTIIVSFEDHGLNVTTKTVKVKTNP